MPSSYRIRKATQGDRRLIQDLIRESLASEKKIPHPSMVKSRFIEEFVDKMIAKGEMLVVENHALELEMIGEIHDYQTTYTHSDKSFRELFFFSRPKKVEEENETSLVAWLYDEIEQKHHDVFRVKLSASLSQHASVDFFKDMGLSIEGSYAGRMKASSSEQPRFVPMAWFNPSFN